VRRFALPLIAVLLAAGFIALIVFGVSQTGDDRSLDNAVASAKPVTAPQYAKQLPSLNGPTRSLADFRGKVVVLNLWASWCPPCREEAPLLEKTQKRIQSQGGTVVGVTWNDSIPDAKKFAAEVGMTYPQLRDVDGTFAKAYGTKGLPETFIINRQGRIVALRRGEVDTAFLNEKLYPLFRNGTVK